jgi:hypothetical protein
MGSQNWPFRYGSSEPKIDRRDRGIIGVGDAGHRAVRVMPPANSPPKLLDGPRRDNAQRGRPPHGQQRLAPHATIFLFCSAPPADRSAGTGEQIRRRGSARYQPENVVILGDNLANDHRRG